MRGCDKARMFPKFSLMSAPDILRNVRQGEGLKRKSPLSKFLCVCVCVQVHVQCMYMYACTCMCASACLYTHVYQSPCVYKAYKKTPDIIFRSIMQPESQ